MLARFLRSRPAQRWGNKWRWVWFNLPSGGCLDLLEICPWFSWSVQEVQFEVEPYIRRPGDVMPWRWCVHDGHGMLQTFRPRLVLNLIWNTVWQKKVEHERFEHVVALILAASTGVCWLVRLLSESDTMLVFISYLAFQAAEIFSWQSHVLKSQPDRLSQCWLTLHTGYIPCFASTRSSAYSRYNRRKRNNFEDQISTESNEALTRSQYVRQWRVWGSFPFSIVGKEEHYGY